jgi:sugar (pentulose or hexulose) kinase
MEGVALSLAMIDELMPDGSQTDRILQCSGGGAKNQLWLRIIGACLKSAVRFSPNPSDSGILGNYLIAGRQLGWCADYSLPVAVQQEEREIPIDGDWAHRYRDLFALYRTCYPRLKGLFGELGKFASYGAVVD